MAEKKRGPGRPPGSKNRKSKLSPQAEKNVQKMELRR